MAASRARMICRTFWPLSRKWHLQSLIISGPVSRHHMTNVSPTAVVREICPISKNRQSGSLKSSCRVVKCVTTARRREGPASRYHVSSMMIFWPSKRRYSMQRWGHVTRPYVAASRALRIYVLPAHPSPFRAASSATKYCYASLCSPKCIIQHVHSPWAIVTESNWNRA